MIKRVIGIPGDTVEIRDNGVYIKPRENAYFLHELELSGRRYSLREDVKRYSTPYNLKRFILGDDDYFILGDNRNASLDSIDFGPVSFRDIYGQVVLRYWPFKEFGRP